MLARETGTQACLCIISLTQALFYWLIMDHVLKTPGAPLKILLSHLLLATAVTGWDVQPTHWALTYAQLRNAGLFDTLRKTRDDWGREL